MNPPSRALVALCLSSAAVLAPACVAVAAATAAAAGAAGAVYVQGDLEAELDGSPETVASAVPAALAQLSLPVLSSSATAVDGKVVSETATKTPITIVMKAAGERTHVSIRVGTFGDEEVSVRILEQIRAQLPSA